MNVVALVLSQFVALPAPLTIPPGGPLLIRANVARGGAAEFGGRTIVAFTSAERDGSTRGTSMNGGDLWLASWDGVSVTSRLVCRATTLRYLEAHVAATTDRLLVVSKMTSGINVLMLDPALQPVTSPCGANLTGDDTDDLLVTATGNDFLISSVSTVSGAVSTRWVNSAAQLGMSTVFPATSMIAASPSPVGFDGGVLLVFRTAAAANLQARVLQPPSTNTNAPAANSATYGSWTATMLTTAPALAAWSQTTGAWDLVLGDLVSGSRLATPRTWMTGSSLVPPAPLVLATDAGVGVISWLPGTPSARLDVYGAGPTPAFLFAMNTLPVASAPPGTLITRESPTAYGLSTITVASGLVGSVQAYVNTRPSHQQSVNVAWTSLGWLLLWEEPRTSMPGLIPRWAVRAVLTDGRAANVNELTVQPVPGRSPRLRRRPTQAGPLLASFDLVDGGTTIVPLTVTSSTLFVGSTPFIPDLGALGGFEVSATEIVRWTSGAASADVFLGTALVGAVQTASPRGAFAADRFWLPQSGIAQGAVFSLPGGMQGGPVNIAGVTVEGPIAVGAAPVLLPSELMYAWNEADGGLYAALQTAPPMFDSSVSIGTARFLGGRPVRISDRWLLGMRPNSGGVVVYPFHPTFSTSPVRLSTERGQIVEFESAESPDGGEAAFIWTAWEDDSQDAGLRLSFQLVTLRGDGGVDAGAPDAGAPDAGAPDAGAPDAGAPDAGGSDAGNVDGGPLDAGLSDGGAPDAGAPDAAVDGGGGSDAGASSDGGAADAGSGDAGPGPSADGGLPSEFAFVPTSCGCDASGGALGLLALAMSLSRRRRSS